jgi:hypothetical protein
MSTASQLEQVTDTTITKAYLINLTLVVLLAGLAQTHPGLASYDSIFARDCTGCDYQQQHGMQTIL